MIHRFSVVVSPPTLHFQFQSMANYYSGYAPTDPSSSSMGFYSTPPSQPSFYSSSSSTHLDPSTSSHPPVGPLGTISPSNGGQTTPGAEGGMSGGGGGPIMVRNWYNAFTPWTGIQGQEPPLLQGEHTSYFLLL